MKPPGNPALRGSPSDLQTALSIPCNLPARHRPPEADSGEADGCVRKANPCQKNPDPDDSVKKLETREDGWNGGGMDFTIQHARSRIQDGKSIGHRAWSIGEKSTFRTANCERIIYGRLRVQGAR